MKHLAALILVAAVVCAGGTIVSAEQITKVGIIDVVKVYRGFFSQSKMVRDLDERVALYSAEVERLRGEITSLEAQKLEAQKEEQDERVADLSGQILASQEYLNTYTRVTKEQLRMLREELAGDDEFYQQMYEVIRFVAEQGGFSLVFSSALSEIFYHTPEIDITEKVIQELTARQK